jgi:hypothetical protein
MRITHLIRTAVLPLVALFALSTPGHAAQSNTNATRADALFNQASQMEQEISASFPRHLRRTAHLYLKSAALREASDPLKIESLYRAGTLLMTLEPQRAHRVLAQAAELALTHGDVVRTAHIYLDGAWVVASRGSASAEELRVANSYVSRARLLADAPSLSASDRDAIHKRIRSATAPAMATSL